MSVTLRVRAPGLEGVEHLGSMIGGPARRQNSVFRGNEEMRKKAVRRARLSKSVFQPRGLADVESKVFRESDITVTFSFFSTLLQNRIVVVQLCSMFRQLCLTVPS